jgi:hypothetical protein
VGPTIRLVSVLAVGLAGAGLGPAAAQQPDPSRLLAVRRALAALRPDLRLGVFRTFATADLTPGRRVAVVAGGQVPRRDDEWFPETWAVVLLDTQAPGRMGVLDTIRTNDARATIEYATPDEVIVRREGVDDGENMSGDQYRQYFFDPATWTTRGRRIYSAVTAASPVAVQDSVFAVVQITPMPGAAAAYPSLLLAVPSAGGTATVYRPPLDSIYRLEAFGDSLDCCRRAPSCGTASTVYPGQARRASRVTIASRPRCRRPAARAVIHRARRALRCRRLNRPA